MASKKITALGVYSTPIGADVIPIVDTTTSTTKKISQSDLAKSINGNPLIYKAYLTQSGTNDPVPTVIYNTIGTIVWTRSVQGIYIGTLAGVFNSLKTFIQLIGQGLSGDQTAYAVSAVATINTVSINTELAGASADSVLKDSPILIEVYP